MSNISQYIFEFERCFSLYLAAFSTDNGVELCEVIDSEKTVLATYAGFQNSQIEQFLIMR